VGNVFHDFFSNPVNLMVSPVLGAANVLTGNRVTTGSIQNAASALFGGNTGEAAPAESGGGEEPEAPEEMGGQGIEAANKYYAKMAELAEEEAKRSRELWSLYKTKYLPGELAWAKQAFAGQPADQAVNRASSDVGASFDKAANIQARNMQSYGINPASPSYQANQADVQQARAAAEAGARTNARKGINDTNWSRRSQAVSLGRGLLPASSGLSAQGGSMLSQGYSGVANANNAALGAQLSQQQLASQQAFTAQQNQLNRDWQQQQADQAAQSNLWQGLMSGAGTIAGSYFGPAGSVAGGVAGNVAGNVFNNAVGDSSSNRTGGIGEQFNYWG
jgi:hypothetical protein